MKQQVNPALIAGAVAVLALVVFGIYKLTVGGGTGGNIAASNAPAYAKAAQSGNGVSMADHYQKQQQEQRQQQQPQPPKLSDQ